MPKIFKQTPRVVVILETCVQPDREKLDGIFKYVRFYGPWHLHIIQNRVGEQRLAHFEAWHANGVILGQSMLDMEAALSKAKVPLVLIDPLPRHLAQSSPFFRCSCVQNNAVSVGVAAADYFLKQGFKQFAYVGEVMDRLWPQGRRQGIERKQQPVPHQQQGESPPLCVRRTQTQQIEKTVAEADLRQGVDQRPPGVVGVCRLKKDAQQHQRQRHHKAAIRID
jgi:DNA-binding LacI/PurR family transcriptional regulator